MGSPKVNFPRIVHISTRTNRVHISRGQGDDRSREMGPSHRPCREAPAQLGGRGAVGMQPRAFPVLSVGKAQADRVSRFGIGKCE